MYNFVQIQSSIKQHQRVDFLTFAGCGKLNCVLRRIGVTRASIAEYHSVTIDSDEIQLFFCQNMQQSCAVSQPPIANQLELVYLQ